MRIADLPWYDLPELHAATDAWWRGIASHLRRLGVDRVPTALARDGSHVARWQHRDLLLSQACGYDVLYDAEPWITPLATPCYAAMGCAGPRYASIVVVHEESTAEGLSDLRGSRVVVNEASSHSGTNALRPLIAPLSRDGAFFGSVEVTGSHTDSLRAVQERRADTACIDAVVFELMRQVRPQALRGVRVLVQTGRALAPPYVTSVHTPPAMRQVLQQALQAALRDPELDTCRRALLLEDFVMLPASAYAELTAFESPALHAGYHELPAPVSSPLHRRGASPRTERGSCA